MSGQTQALRTAPERTALVIGAGGSFGLHATLALIGHGWQVRALVRDPAKAAARHGQRLPVQWVRGDAMNPAEVAEAARGAQVIVHAVNPPGYRNWAGTVLPMLASTIAAAKAEGARIVLPGTVYNFAPDSGPMIREDAPQQPVTRKGKIRAEMERMLRAASEEGARALVLRAGDFFGPAAPNSALAWLTLRTKGRVTGVFKPGPASVGHAFAYLPDMVEAMARLLDCEADLASYEVFHFRGHWLQGDNSLAAAVRRATGRPQRVLPFPVPMLWALAPFNETFREMLEMLYLWRRPIGLDNSKLVAFLGAEPHTDLDSAVRAALTDLETAPAEPAAAVRPVLA
ncbi:NAD-dependent epimerase/dehydratase family protein [Phenylobacterium montanum]|uniref:NAD(P)H-binding protein n=1 Tax=Phenylobacterium montanum TaxID=2823693 RepID=A0A975IUX1_9CAUL|nr:NAD-dependent epimerase/dehydratase family protein [Caulobacter sp. S6]QUD86701.1 NAD(P)H-binding protein [Caulobacter sp. S6]